MVHFTLRAFGLPEQPQTMRISVHSTTRSLYCISLLALRVLLCYADSSLPMVLWVDFKPLISQGALAVKSTVL